ncbi:hypothetical protein CC1G_13916 [Coprinopsis cinerea okayama7|uniref:Anaphase-promoting complex subunit 5 n=1 Tax=Coprinopsis cinerea (strain Okayama-7 / 130 / ATCC MYA-4618 / FGSC 9003) TaxID=240176 RepID=D6RKG6_COPC7|nr:hypothetical protein CC1G_13916 [Coprinopsis cinerea okayama7\|eukprot:XP_002911876.1 hypothetical protein CC1G_13916 [Coprinopsis cinerea okayama7\
MEIKKLPPSFSLHLLRILLNEVSEPKSHRELMKEINTGPGSTTKESAQFLAAINTIHAELVTTEKLGNFLGNLPTLFIEKIMEDNPRFMRRSLFGYFCRRCFVSFVKLSYVGLVKLRDEYQAWCAGLPVPSYNSVPEVDLTIDYLLQKTSTDRKSWAQAETYAAWEKGKAIGDENIAVENIRRFFEQHFHDNTDSSGFRQHALLNVVQMHYVNKEYVAARKLLGEAISVSRTANDRATLLHCLSLLHRLPPAPGFKATINEIQPDLDPLELLFDVKKLMDEQNEQPLSTAFSKIVQATGLYDHRLDVSRDRESSVPNEEYQWAQHAVQAYVWKEAGCSQLAALEEDIVIAFTDIGGDNSIRLSVLLNRAYTTALGGDYKAALALLLDPTTWRGITIPDYRLWAHEIWCILALRSVRREYLLPRKPQGEFNPRYFSFEELKAASLPAIRQCIYQVLQFKAEFLGRYDAYRTGIVLMADFGLEFNMAKKSKRILGEIMPQILTSTVKELRATACFTYARCLLAAADEVTPAVIEEALYYLSFADMDFDRLEMRSSAKEVLYMQAVLYENLGQTDKRNERMHAYDEAEKAALKMGKSATDSQSEQVYNLVVEVGAALARR